MTDKGAAGFCEISHGADAALEVWASDLPALFQQAALGMLALMGVELAGVGSVRRSLRLTAPDDESMLVLFLSELLFLLEQEQLVFSATNLTFRQGQLQASLVGSPLGSIQREIKAVTFNDLAIHRAGDCLRVTIVFDL
ncbi:MAG: archease [Anaerolineaceae bacterium]|nr:archease [Anaerolineaceae bacterium]